MEMRVGVSRCTRTWAARTRPSPTTWYNAENGHAAGRAGRQATCGATPGEFRWRCGWTVRTRSGASVARLPAAPSYLRSTSPTSQSTSPWIGRASPASTRAAKQEGFGSRSTRWAHPRTTSLHRRRRWRRAARIAQWGWLDASATALARGLTGAALSLRCRRGPAGLTRLPASRSWMTLPRRLLRSDGARGSCQIGRDQRGRCRWRGRGGHDRLDSVEARIARIVVVPGAERDDPPTRDGAREPTLHARRSEVRAGTTDGFATSSGIIPLQGPSRSRSTCPW